MRGLKPLVLVNILCLCPFFSIPFYSLHAVITFTIHVNPSSSPFPSFPCKQGVIYLATHDTFYLSLPLNPSSYTLFLSLPHMPLHTHKPISSFIHYAFSHYTTFHAHRHFFLKTSPNPFPFTIRCIFPHAWPP